MVAEITNFTEQERKTYQMIHKAGCDAFEVITGSPCIPDLKMMKIFLSLSQHLCRKG